MVLLGEWLDLMILEVFSTYDSMKFGFILCLGCTFVKHHSSVGFSLTFIVGELCHEITIWDKTMRWYKLV